MTLIKGETVLFDDSQKATLAFPPARLERIYNLALGVEYDLEKDLAWTPGSTLLTRPTTSAVPYLTHDELYIPADRAVFFPADNSNAVPDGPNGIALRFDARNFFAQHQLEVDYWTDAPMPSLCPQGEKLPRFRSNPAFKLAFIGDSITEGVSSSKYVGVPPFQPSYAGLLVEKLHPAQSRNFGVSGTNTDHGLQHLDAWLDEFCPDLLVIAYGMNELIGEGPAKFQSSICELIAIARRHNPQMEFVLVGSMPGNGEWKNTPPEATRALAIDLETIAKDDPAIACVNVGGFWEKCFANKKFVDLTGNGVNHPNDFGYRFYADTIAKALGVE
jgi:acyl-CoA thioesterase I